MRACLAMFLFLILFSVSVAATDYANITASIGNARMILRPEVIPNQSNIISKTILVLNPNSIDIKIDIEPSEEFKPYVTVLDASFILKPNASKDARFLINLTQPGRYEGKILVTFSPDTDLLNSSVGLASNIIIFASLSNKTAEDSTTSAGNPFELNKLILPAAIIFVLLVLILIFVIYSRSGKSKNKKGKKK